jgi:iron complex transport system substrate-binding protein
VAVGAVFMLGTLPACGGREAQEQEASTPAATAPQRIVAIAPSVTEMLFVLGLGERVVGVGDYARWPPEAAAKPRLGGLFDSRLESIAALDPDLAILLPSEERLRRNLEKMGVEVLTVCSDTLADVVEMAVVIAERCGAEEALERFLEDWDRELRPRRSVDSPRVLLSVTREPGRMADVLVAGSQTFLHELVERLGATNVMADAEQAYPQVGLEEIVLRQPEVVIELQAVPGDYASLPEDWARVAGDLGVAGVCVWVVAGDHVLIPGPRVPRLYQELADALAGCAERRD